MGRTLMQWDQFRRIHFVFALHLPNDELTVTAHQKFRGYAAFQRFGQAQNESRVFCFIVCCAKSHKSGFSKHFRLLRIVENSPRPRAPWIALAAAVKIESVHGVSVSACLRVCVYFILKLSTSK